MRFRHQWQRHHHLNGLFETFDAGKNWKSLTDKVPVNRINKIEVKKGIIYISTGYRFKNPLRFSTVKKEF